MNHQLNYANGNTFHFFLYSLELGSQEMISFSIAGYQPVESKPRTYGQLRGGVGMYISIQLSIHAVQFETNFECHIMKIFFLCHKENGRPFLQN